MLKYPDCDLLPHSVSIFSSRYISLQKSSFILMLTSFSSAHLLSHRWANWAHYPFWMRVFRHLHLLCMLTVSVPCYSSVSVLSSHFQISSPAPFFSPSPKASWELSSTNFRLYQWLGLTTPQRSTPQIDEPSDADLLYMAATLEPPHIWSGVHLLKNRGQPWPKQV